uniref:C3H1-type domain-containing protein n=1 Tax=Parastrongyloides trichosuri TaxID=131310 RepID=A0A0N4ZYQ8_PARTI
MVSNDDKQCPIFCDSGLEHSIGLYSKSIDVLSRKHATHLLDAIIQKLKKDTPNNKKSSISRSHRNRDIFFKTKLCHHFERNGECPRSYKCCYAHGKNELRKRPRSDYKNIKKVCLYFKKGYCKYGEKCKFVHNLNGSLESDYNSDKDFYYSTNSFKRSKISNFPDYRNGEEYEFDDSNVDTRFSKTFSAVRRKKFINSFRKNGSRFSKSQNKVSILTSEPKINHDNKSIKTEI